VSTEQPRSSARAVTEAIHPFRTYLGISNNVAKSGYRGDLRSAAVARASAIRKSQRPVKESPEKKLRGAKAKKAAAEKES
jgi:large subunit ribosomal protein L28e